MRKIVQCAVLLISIVFIALGIWRNEVSVLFNKAIHICLECIGIG